MIYDLEILRCPINCCASLVRAGIHLYDLLDPVAEARGGKFQMPFINANPEQFGSTSARLMAQQDAAVVQRLVEAWKSVEKLCDLGARGCMAKVPGAKELERKDIAPNVQVLKPIVQHLGTLAESHLVVAVRIRYATRGPFAGRCGQRILGPLPAQRPEASRKSGA